MRRYSEAAWEWAMKVQKVILRALAKKIAQCQAAGNSTTRREDTTGCSIGVASRHEPRLAVRSPAPYLEPLAGMNRCRRNFQVVDSPGCRVTIPVSIPFHSLPKGLTKLNCSSTATNSRPRGE